VPLPAVRGQGMWQGGAGRPPLRHGSRAAAPDASDWDGAAGSGSLTLAVQMDGAGWARGKAAPRT